MKGTIKKFYPEKGFGFIGLNGGETNVYFHISSLRCSRGRMRGVPVGAEVSFVLTRGYKGVQAADVVLLELPESALTPKPEEVSA